MRSQRNDGGAGLRATELLNDRERLAILSLWAVPGIGPKTFAAIVGFFGNDVTAVLGLAPHEWVGALSLSVPVREMLSRVRKMSDLGECMMERARRANVGIAFPGDPAFPPRLVEIADPPPVLFFRGTPSAPRRRIAMVGSRRPDQGFLPFAQHFASEVAEGGVGIVSGAAIGVDCECHEGALKVGAETWAFTGSALDELDPPQASLLPKVLKGGGMFFTELPLGVRASTTTFPRRNRLISGAADAVLVLRAGIPSGALHTAQAAVLQGRPLLAMPGEANNKAAFGCNGLIRSGHARLCLTPQDAWAAVGIVPGVSARPRKAGLPLDLDSLSDNARIAYGVVGQVPLSLDDVLLACGLPSGSLISALCELELMGLVVQHPGRRYQRV